MGRFVLRLAVALAVRCLSALPARCTICGLARAGARQQESDLPDSHPFVRWTGIALAIAATWPMAEALQAIARKDYLAGALLLGLTWVVARTGLDLATARDSEAG